MSIHYSSRLFVLFSQDLVSFNEILSMDIIGVGWGGVSERGAHFCSKFKSLNRSRPHEGIVRGNIDDRWLELASICNFGPRKPKLGPRTLIFIKKTSKIAMAELVWGGICKKWYGWLLAWARLGSSWLESDSARAGANVKSGSSQRLIPKKGSWGLFGRVDAPLQTILWPMS